LRIKALEAGTATITWYESVPPAKSAKKGKAKQLVIASGKLHFSTAGTKSLSLRFTAAGKALLRHSTHRLKLTARGVFTPTGGSAVSVTRGFTLPA
jgi:hypothetical protein